MAMEQPKKVPNCYGKESKTAPAKTAWNSGAKSEGPGIPTQKNTIRLSALPKERAPVSGGQCAMGQPTDLEERIKKKIIELVEKEETLVDLYKKAADAAKKREEELRDKTAVLMQQLEKDKSLMNILKRVK